MDILMVFYWWWWWWWVWLVLDDDHGGWLVGGVYFSMYLCVYVCEWPVLNLVFLHNHRHHLVVVWCLFIHSFVHYLWNTKQTKKKIIGGVVFLTYSNSNVFDFHRCATLYLSFSFIHSNKKNLNRIFVFF